jgi:hypothetical protein
MIRTDEAPVAEDELGTEPDRPREVPEAMCDFDQIPEYTDIFLLAGGIVLVAKNTNEGPHRLIAEVSEHVLAYRQLDLHLQPGRRLIRRSSVISIT